MMKALFLAILFLFLLAPAPAFAQFNFIICDPASPDRNDHCDFEDLVQLAQNIVNGLILLSTFLATAVFAYAGFLLLTSGGDTATANKAKGILLKVVKGYVWILVAWLLVYTITRVLLAPGFDFLGPPTP